MNSFLSIIGIGFGLAFLWVVFWAFFVPEVTPILTWSGYEALTAPLFVVGCFGGAVGWAWYNLVK